jgi:hypothetical protein
MSPESARLVVAPPLAAERPQSQRHRAGPTPEVFVHDIVHSSAS